MSAHLRTGTIHLYVVHEVILGSSASFYSVHLRLHLRLLSIYLIPFPANYEYRPENIVMMLDGEGTPMELQPTRENIVSTLQSAFLDDG